MVIVRKSRSKLYNQITLISQVIWNYELNNFKSDIIIESEKLVTYGDQACSYDSWGLFWGRQCLIFTLLLRLNSTALLLSTEYFIKWRSSSRQGHRKVWNSKGEGVICPRPLVEIGLPLKKSGREPHDVWFKKNFKGNPYKIYFSSDL